MRSVGGVAGMVSVIGATMAVPTNAAPERLGLPMGQQKCGPIVTPGQLALEKTAIAVMASSPVRREKARLARLYRADPQGATPAGRANIARAVDSIANAAVQYIVNNTAQPQVMWVTKAPFRMGRLSVARSGYGIDNPDNVYRNIPIDPAASYEITGRFAPDGPVQLHFTLMDAIPGTKPLTVEGGGFVGTISSDEMEFGADGQFTVTVGPDPANGRHNHIQTNGGGELLMVVRDLFTDWGRQQPTELHVRKLGGPDTAPPSRADMAHRSAQLLAQIGPYWLAYDNRFIYARPANSFATPRLRPGGRGLSMSGWFQLDPAEALVVTLDPLGAKSLGVQLADPWGVAYDYVNRTSSFNNTQAKPNPDGTITYVIAARDPGAMNWLDPSGYSGGIMTIRWQGLPSGVNPERAVRAVRKVTLPLPADIALISPDQRRDQLRQRSAAYWRRTFGRPDFSACGS